jgi:hypothetical protein
MCLFSLPARRRPRVGAPTYRQVGELPIRALSRPSHAALCGPPNRVPRSDGRTNSAMRPAAPVRRDDGCSGEVVGLHASIKTAMHPLRIGAHTDPKSGKASRSAARPSHLRTLAGGEAQLSCDRRRSRDDLGLAGDLAARPRGSVALTFDGRPKGAVHPEVLGRNHDLHTESDQAPLDCRGGRPDVTQELRMFDVRVEGGDERSGGADTQPVEPLADARRRQRFTTRSACLAASARVEGRLMPNACVGPPTTINPTPAR